VLVAFLGWDMTYIIRAPERAVVLRFGAHAATLDAGLNLRLPRPIERVEVINVERIRSVKHTASILTGDENIVDVELVVLYRVTKVEDYAFNVVGPDDTVEQATESAVRTVIGKNDMDFVLTEGRGAIAAQIQENIQELVDTYKAGIIVTSVNMQAAKPPEEVKSAFDDAIKAREDEQRLINEAEAYRNEVIPKARGKAARVLEDARAYKGQVINEAEGNASRFVQLLVEYEKAPEITRERLYLEAIESVLSNAPKVLLDTERGNNLVYLPLDKLFERRETEPSLTTSEQDILDQRTPRPPMRPDISGSEMEPSPDDARSRVRESR
jgi:membrane protease subunit HflK